jgi:hypothetical protein
MFGRGGARIDAEGLWGVSEAFCSRLLVTVGGKRAGGLLLQPHTPEANAMQATVAKNATV